MAQGVSPQHPWPGFPAQLCIRGHQYLLFADMLKGQTAGSCLQRTAWQGWLLLCFQGRGPPELAFDQKCTMKPANLKIIQRALKDSDRLYLCTPTRPSPQTPSKYIFVKKIVNQYPK